MTDFLVYFRSFYSCEVLNYVRTYFVSIILVGYNVKDSQLYNVGIC